MEKNSISSTKAGDVCGLLAWCNTRAQKYINLMLLTEAVLTQKHFKHKMIIIQNYIILMWHNELHFQAWYKFKKNTYHYMY